MVFRGGGEMAWPRSYLRVGGGELVRSHVFANRAHVYLERARPASLAIIDVFPDRDTTLFLLLSGKMNRSIYHPVVRIESRTNRRSPFCSRGRET